MQQGFQNDEINKIHYLIGDLETINTMRALPAKVPFHETVVSFCHEVSGRLRAYPEVREYPEIATLAFWLRKASVCRMRERFAAVDGDYHLGRGIVFHIAPSNVPVNYAYSLFAGLLTGNANIVRIPSKMFPQVDIINQAISESLEDWEEIRPYICLIRYERNQAVNDFFSKISDVRIIWGGDQTIADVRKSVLKPRGTEITFADRFSLTVIDSDVYLSGEHGEVIARRFYNDTYYSDQNACTSPMLVVWTGKRKEEAQQIFWKLLHLIVEQEYGFQDIQGVDKLTTACKYFIQDSASKITQTEDNLIYRIHLQKLTSDIIESCGNSGFFFEYFCNNIMELQALCEDLRVQTIGYIGDAVMFNPLFNSGVHGIDRIVPVGHTMDFDLLWDGYNLYERMTRTVQIV